MLGNLSIGIISKFINGKLNFWILKSKCAYNKVCSLLFNNYCFR